ncbi:transient receptor potential-gamma protein-like [Ctenocephalides felis]|uniref:transient receptor potential-gamma protein-like n=1 Tax=Ctenocephalides felis TaxID=7515 RepID=UPI000E6E2392|nr:transient receptor potential-gamma protein-like [Ctenocephalides felis]
MGCEFQPAKTTRHFHPRDGVMYKLYYADLEKKRCPDIQSFSSSYPANHSIQEPVDPNACTVWRRFANLFETTQTLFWAVFGLVDLDSFELDGIKIFTRFWGMLMFGTYSVINIVVLLNLLIAMMNHSYQLISAIHSNTHLVLMQN